MQTAIALIEKLCGPYFSDNRLTFKQSGFGRYILSGYTTLAENIFKNGNTQINVLHWFANFWIYIEINFIPTQDVFPQITITVSVFFGDAADAIKNQLFRAEWDNYSDNVIHPQPHWHFYSIENKPKYYDDFQTYLGMREEDGTFDSELDSALNNKSFDIRLMHFAMDGRWADSGSFIHKINNEQMIAKWISGLLKSIKEQLEYVLRD